MKAALAITLLLAAQHLAAQTDPRARVFVQRGCSECHAVTGLKVKAKTDVGPDLTDAYAEVTNRYGLTLERFFEQPVGVMRLVLSGHAQVTKADSDSLVAILRALYLERLAARERDGSVPHPPRLRRGT
jgi:cytochrome c551/c552